MLGVFSSSWDLGSLRDSLVIGKGRWARGQAHSHSIFQPMARVMLANISLVKASPKVQLSIKGQGSRLFP